MTQGKKPALRFKGFDNDWEQRKLGNECFEIVAGGDVDKTKLLQDGKYPVIANALTDEGIIGYYSNEYRIKAPAVTVTGRGDVGHARARKINFTPVVRLLSVVSKHDVDFLAESINQNDIVLESTGVPQLTVPALANYLLCFPPTIKEEKRIGQYFSQLNHLLTLHQRKLEKLQNLKKAMLEKMFPKNGAKVPEIRFKGFTNDWEQRKLGDVLVLLKDGTHGTHKDAESGPLLLSAKNIKDGTVHWDESDRRISEDEYNSIHTNFQLQKGDVLLTIVGSIGETAILSQSKGVTFQRSVAFLRPSDEISSEFLYSEIQGQKFQKELNDRKSTSAQPGIYLGDLGAIPIEFPTSDEEQTKVGRYFRNLDHLITLHQRKLEKLQNLKKAMLEKMFI